MAADLQSPSFEHEEDAEAVPHGVDDIESQGEDDDPGLVLIFSGTML
jgi:hypothetical protein